MINMKKLRSVIAVILCLAVAFFAQTFSVTARGGGNSVTIKSKQNLFEPFTQSAIKGETFDVVIKLRSDLKVIDGTVKLGFDSSSLRVTGCSGDNGITPISNITEQRQTTDNSVITTFTAGENFYDFTNESSLLTYTFSVIGDTIGNQEVTIDFVNLIANNTVINTDGDEQIAPDGDEGLIAKSEVKSDGFSVKALFANPKGDVNLDGKVDVNDVTVLQLGIVGKIELSEKQLSLAQVYYDNKINIRDVTIIQLYLVDRINYL